MSTGSTYGTGTYNTCRALFSTNFVNWPELCTTSDENKAIDRPIEPDSPSTYTNINLQVVRKLIYTDECAFQAHGCKTLTRLQTKYASCNILLKWGLIHRNKRSSWFVLRRTAVLTFKQAQLRRNFPKRFGPILPGKVTVPASFLNRPRITLRDEYSVRNYRANLSGTFLWKLDREFTTQPRMNDNAYDSYCKRRSSFYRIVSCASHSNII